MMTLPRIHSWATVALWLAAAAAHSKEVVFAARDASPREYQAFLAAQDHLESPTQYLLNNRPAKEMKEKLIQAFAEAQEAFVGADPARAEEKLKAVLALATQADWLALDRTIFAISALRLAQLAANSERRQFWLERAASLGVDEVDAALFPPPLLRDWQKVKSELPPIAIPVAGLSPGDWTRVLINGVPCAQSPCLVRASMDSPVRATWLSDRWQTQTVITELSQLPQAQPARLTWIDGPCQAPRFSEATQMFAQHQAFFNLECGQKINLADLKPRPPEPVGLAFPVVPKPQRRPFYKSTWTWIGVGTVVAIVVASQIQRGKERSPHPPPSTTYGD